MDPRYSNRTPGNDRRGRWPERVIVVLGAHAALAILWTRSPFNVPVALAAVAPVAVAPVAGLTALALVSTTAVIRRDASAWLIAPVLLLVLWTLGSSWPTPFPTAAATGVALGVTISVLAVRPPALRLPRATLLAAAPAVFVAALASATFVAIALLASAGVAARFVAPSLRSAKATAAFAMLVLAPVALAASRVPVEHLASSMPTRGAWMPDWTWQWHLQEAATGIHFIVIAAALWLLLHTNRRSGASPESA